MRNRTSFPGSIVYAAALSTLSLACGSDGDVDGREAAAPRVPDSQLVQGPDQTSEGELGTAPTFEFEERVGGQSGVEGGCFDANPTTRDVGEDELIDAIGFRVSDVLEFAAGSHSTSLRWAVLDPPGAGAADAKTVDIGVSFVGPARVTLSHCGSYFELPVGFEIRSSSGALELGGSGTLTTGELTPGVAHLNTDVAVSQQSSWVAAAEPILDLGGSPSFPLSLTLSKRGVSGGFHIRGQGLCTLAAWPAAASCPVGVGDPERGERVRQLFEQMADLPPPELHSTDGTTTSASITVVDGPRTACLGRRIDANGQVLPGEVYRAPIELRITTADGRVDATLPAHLSGHLNEAGEWSGIGFNTPDGAVTAGPQGFGRFDFAGMAATDRAVVTLAGSAASGTLLISALTPRSPELRDVINAGCVSAPATNDGAAQAGRVREIVRATWP